MRADIIRSTVHRNPAWLAAVLGSIALSGLSGPVGAEPGADGTWVTPLGRVRLEQKDGATVGHLLERSRNCSALAKGDEVLRGRISDGVFTGELRLCWAKDCPAKDGWAFTLAARVDDDRFLGAVAPWSPCRSPAVPERSYEMKRSPEGEAGRDRPRPERAIDPQARALIGEAGDLIGAGSFEAARRKLLKADELEPKNPTILMMIGVTHYARNDFPRARAFYEKALQANPRHFDAYYNLACLLAREGRVGEALFSLRRAAEYGYSDFAAMDADADLRTVRDDPAYAEIRALVLKRKPGRR